MTIRVVIGKIKAITGSAGSDCFLGTRHEEHQLSYAIADTLGLYFCNIPASIRETLIVLLVTLGE